MLFWSAHQEPEVPGPWALLRRACHGSHPADDIQVEEAVTALFGISLFSIPRG